MGIFKHTVILALPLLLMLYSNCKDSKPLEVTENGKPEILALTANPESLEAGQKSSLTCNASDPDDDELSYQWEAASGTITGSGNSVEWTSPNDSTGIFSIICIVTDNSEEQDSLAVNIQVSAPAMAGMVFVTGGTLRIGSNYGGEDEKPSHFVTVRSFYIDQYEVTNTEYADFLNNTGNQEEGGAPWLDINSSRCSIVEDNGIYRPKSGFEQHPVIEVSWFGAKAYCDMIGARLPTEAEWEYAARGGQESKSYIYSGSNNPDDVAWWGESQIHQTHMIGTKEPNELGLYDMSGNVWEWCADWYQYDYYANSESYDPQGPDSGTNRVKRGGSWNHDKTFCRSSARFGQRPDITDMRSGFRCVKTF